MAGDRGIVQPPARISAVLRWCDTNTEANRETGETRVRALGPLVRAVEDPLLGSAQLKAERTEEGQFAGDVKTCCEVAFSSARGRKTAQAWTDRQVNHSPIDWRITTANGDEMSIVRTRRLLARTLPVRTAHALRGTRGVESA
jgi:hypothetical protein